MSDITVNKNFTVTIQGQTFVLSGEEAQDLFNKLKSAGIGNDESINPWPWLPPQPWWPTGPFYSDGGTSSPPPPLPVTLCKSTTD